MSDAAVESAEETQVDDVKVIKEGYIGKKMKHSMLRGVKQRYFKLLDYELLYWYTKEDMEEGKEPLAYIPLKAFKLETPHGRTAQKHAFRLSLVDQSDRLVGGKCGDKEDAPEHDKYVMICETAEEKTAWENAIREQTWKASTKDDTVLKQRRLTGFAPPSINKGSLSLQPAIGEDEEEEEED